jgi:Rrf2 family protein
MRLEVTRKSDLAICALIALAERGELMKRADLSEAVSAAPAFMAQVMTPLVRAGWVESSPGPTGGYQLLVDLDHVSVLEVVEVVEGPTDNGQCVVAGACGDEGYCALHAAWTEARRTLSVHLANTSVADALAPEATCLIRSQKKVKKP